MQMIVRQLDRLIRPPLPISRTLYFNRQILIRSKGSDDHNSAFECCLLASTVADRCFDSRPPYYCVHCCCLLPTTCVNHENPRLHCKYSKIRIPPSSIVMKSSAISLHSGILLCYLLASNCNVPKFATSRKQCVKQGSLTSAEHNSEFFAEKDRSPKHIIRGALKSDSP
jgi:hypothetical protein